MSMTSTAKVTARDEVLDPEAISDVIFGEDTVTTGDDMYRLGLKYSTGAGAPLDLIQAHKWFNLAALNGSREARTYRRELAEQMSSEDVAAAQRAAREWLQANSFDPSSRAS